MGRISVEVSHANCCIPLQPPLAYINQPKTFIASDVYQVYQVNQFTYLGRSIFCQFSNDVELRLAQFLQLIGTIKRTIFRKVRTETILKLYNTLVLPAFLYGSENWTLTASQRRRIEAAEM
jgi:hypothetical protein